MTEKTKSGRAATVNTMTDTVRDWTAILKAAGVPSPCDSLRPFVCDGLPCSCDFIVVGENSATELETDWWNFWSDEGGFVYSRFEEVRAEKCDNEGKGTRARLDRIMERTDIKCVITNVFSNEKPDGAGATPKSNVGVLCALLENMPQLRAVIVHGEKAKKKWREENLGDIGFVRKNRLADNDMVLFTPHFIYMGYDRLARICDTISAQKERQQ